MTPLGWLGGKTSTQTNKLLSNWFYTQHQVVKWTYSNFRKSMRFTKVGKSDAIFCKAHLALHCLLRPVCLNTWVKCNLQLVRMHSNWWKHTVRSWPLLLVSTFFNIWPLCSKYTKTIENAWSDCTDVKAALSRQCPHTVDPHYSDNILFLKMLPFK